MKLKEFLDSIEEDISIDPGRLTYETARTPRLHTKYMRLWLDEKRKLQEQEHKKAVVWLNRRDFFLGAGTDEHGDRYPRTILKNEVDLYLKADPAVQQIESSIGFRERIVKILERALAEIDSRSFKISTIQKQQMFEAGK